MVVLLPPGRTTKSALILCLTAPEPPAEEESDEGRQPQGVVHGEDEQGQGGQVQAFRVPEPEPDARVERPAQQQHDRQGTILFRSEKQERQGGVGQRDQAQQTQEIDGVQRETRLGRVQEIEELAAEEDRDQARGQAIESGKQEQAAEEVAIRQRCPRELSHSILYSIRAGSV